MDELVALAQSQNVLLSATHTELFSQLLEELKAWNAHTNLTAIRDDRDAITKHFLDSLTVLQAIPTQAKTLIDIGTGAGFPGFVIAIMRPDIQVTLLESVGKKTSFHKHAIETLGLKNVTALNARAEDIAHDKTYREMFDIATARAVAELRILVEFALPLLKKGGIFIAQKTAGTEEIDAAQHAIATLGGTIIQTIPVSLPELNARQLIIIEKTNSTPDEYPRHSGLPTKNPL